MFRGGFPTKTGAGNRPTAPTGGGPRLRVAPPTNRPISGRRGNLRVPGTALRKSGNRDFGISPGIHVGGGLLDSGGAFPDVSVARFRGGPRRKRGPKIDQVRRPAWRFLWREIWKDLVSCSPQATPGRRPLAASGYPLPPTLRVSFLRPFAATPCRPLLSRRTPFYAKNSPAGGSRPAGGRP